MAEAASIDDHIDASEPTAGPSEIVQPSAEGSEAKPEPKYQKRKAPPPPTPEELEESLLRRVTTIKRGDNVYLRLPSDAIKAVVVSDNGLVQLGKYGAFPCKELIGLHYDITYEIYKKTDDSSDLPSASTSTSAADMTMEDASSSGFGQKIGKKAKKAKKDNKDTGHQDKVRSNPTWQNALRPQRRRPIVDAIVDDIQETNEFIEDDDSKLDTLTHEEIAELRKQGISAEEMIKRQMARHDKFALKTDFSKEKWRKRKEKKFSQTVHPIAPTVANITQHFLSRSPYATLHLREDTMSQLLNLSNIRPDGRYLVVDDTGGLITAAMLDRMGCQGRILTFVDSDSPPAWGVLSVMNFSQEELSGVKWLSWLEADEDYVKPPPPDEDKANLPEISAHKTQSRMRKHAAQVNELNQTRNELYMGNWDGLIVASELDPMSVLARLTPYIIGSGNVTVYSPHQQVLAETLQWMRKDPNYTGQTLSESWSRTYQVLPGRTHPLMTTSATGGYLLNAIRIHPSSNPVNTIPRPNPRRKAKVKTEGDAAASGTATPTNAVSSSVEEDEAEQLSQMMDTGDAEE